MSANAVGERCNRCVRGGGRAGEKRVCAHQQLSQWAAAHRRRRAVQRYGELVQQKVGARSRLLAPLLTRGYRYHRVVSHLVVRERAVS